MLWLYLASFAAECEPDGSTLQCLNLMKQVLGLNRILHADVHKCLVKKRKL